MKYNEVPATENPDPPMRYETVPATDEHGVPLPDGVSLSAGYGGMVKADLTALIDARNATRPEFERIAPVSTKNEDLIAALEADDAATEEN